MDIALGDFAIDVSIANGARSIDLAITVRTDRGDVEKAGLVAYAFYDRDEAVLEPVEPYSRSDVHGPYVYLAPSDTEGNSVTRKKLQIPDGAARCELRGVRWKNDVKIDVIGSPIVNQPGSDLDTVFEERDGEFVPLHASDFVRTYDVRNSDSVRISAAYRALNNDKVSKALILVELLDALGDKVPPTGELPVNPKLGSFIYLESAVNQGDSTISSNLQVPKGVEQLRLRGVQWSGGTLALLGPAQVELTGTEKDTQSGLKDFIESIPQDDNLVVIYTTARAIGNGSLLLRSNRLALEYAAAGNWVVFFPFGSLAEDESATPAERIFQLDRKHFRAFMDLAIQRRGSNNKFICSSFSDLNVTASIDRLHDHSWKVVYEVRDDMEEFNRVGYSKWFHPLLEARVAKRADSVVAVSPRLQEKAATIGRRDDVRLIPNAAPDELVAATSYLRDPSSIPRRMQSSTVGYIGHLTPSWFDWDLLIQVAKRLPSVKFQIIGHEFPSNLTLPMNVEYLGAMPHSECIAYAENWRAGLIPFKISPLTYGVDPNKIYEYVAMGLRTVTAPMGSVQDIPGSWVYQSVEGAVEGVLDAINREITADELLAYDEYITRTKWSDRADQMMELLDGNDR